MENLSLERENIIRPKRTNLNQEMNDEEFNKVIDRILKEATQY